MTPPRKSVPAADAPARTAAHADIAELPYEAARDELMTIVQRLEGGQAGLEESMRLWERGEALADHCATWLDGAERRLRGEGDPDAAASQSRASTVDGNQDAGAFGTVDAVGAPAGDDPAEP